MFSQTCSGSLLRWKKLQNFGVLFYHFLWLCVKLSFVPVAAGCCRLQPVAAGCNSLWVGVGPAFDVAEVILMPLGLNLNSVLPWTLLASQLRAEQVHRYRTTQLRLSQRFTQDAEWCLKFVSARQDFFVPLSLTFACSPTMQHINRFPRCIIYEAQFSSFELLRHSRCCSQPPASITKLHLINRHNRL